MIREATDDDIPRLIEMGTRFVAETEYHGRLAIKSAAMARTFGLLINSDQGALFVSDHGGTLTGMIGLFVFEHPFTGELAAHELFWWTDGEHRGRPDSLRLLRCGEEWARGMGAVTVHMVAPVGSHIGTLYRRRGYEELESSWQLDFARVERDGAARRIASARGDTVIQSTDVLPLNTAPGRP